MPTRGEIMYSAWTSGDPQAFGKLVDRLRFRHGGTFQTQRDVHQFLCDALRKRGYFPLPSLADMDERLYEYEHFLT